MIEQINRREKQAKDIAIGKGYEVLRSGWPDFLLYKESENKAVFLEVKAKQGVVRLKNGRIAKKRNLGKTQSALNHSQRRMFEVLRKLGLNCQIIYIE